MVEVQFWWNGETIIVKNKKQFDWELLRLSDEVKNKNLSRNQGALVFTRFINKRMPMEDSSCDVEKLKHLDQKGYVKLDNLFSKVELQEIIDVLSTKDVCNQHVPPGQKKFKIENSDNRFNSYFLEDILKCPHLLKACLEKEVVDLAQSYLGCVPTLYSINVYWMLKNFTGCSEGPDIISGIQKFHRDYDDYKFLCFFVYLTDVDDNSAPHLFIEGSHLTEGYSYDINKVKKFIGPMGTTVAEDTYGFHSGGSGAKELKNDRLVLWFRFGLHKNSPTLAQLPRPFHKSKVNCDGINFDEKTKFITRFCIDHGSDK